MHIIFKISGGIAFFPNLNKPFTIDTDKLPIEKTQDLISLIQETGFFNLPKQIGNIPRRGADMQSYTIEVENEGKVHNVQLFEPVENSKLIELIDYLRKELKASLKRQ
jgi:hypothetical protein